MDTNKVNWTENSKEVSWIYVVEGFSLESYRRDTWPAKAFKTREDAENFLVSENGALYASEGDDAESGWAYSLQIHEVKLT